jgi:hypothetical protein
MKVFVEFLQSILLAAAFFISLGLVMKLMWVSLQFGWGLL